MCVCECVRVYRTLPRSPRPLEKLYIRKNVRLPPLEIFILQPPVLSSLSSLLIRAGEYMHGPSQATAIIPLLSTLIHAAP